MRSTRKYLFIQRKFILVSVLLSKQTWLLKCSKREWKISWKLTTQVKSRCDILLSPSADIRLVFYWQVITFKKSSNYYGANHKLFKPKPIFNSLLSQILQHDRSRKSLNCIYNQSRFYQDWTVFYGRQFWKCTYFIS